MNFFLDFRRPLVTTDALKRERSGVQGGRVEQRYLLTRDSNAAGLRGAPGRQPCPARGRRLQARASQ